MGLFSKRTNDKADSKINSKVLALLDTSDDLYMRSLTEKNPQILVNFARDLIVKINRRMFSNELLYFGSDKFRRTTWKLQSEEGNILHILKTVTFDKVKVGGSLSISVSTGYQEEWEVDSKRFQIMDIRGIDSC